jgi:hypothetical protein
MTDDRQATDHEPWPMRALLLLALGAFFGLAVHLLVRTAEPWTWTKEPFRLGAAAAIVAGGVAFAFSLERLRWAWSAAFAVCAGLVVGFVTYWNGDPDHWGSGEGWRLTAALLAIAIAVPLFQAARDSGRRRLDPRAVHDNVWTNLILWFLAWAFVGALWLTFVLLGGLFELIGLDFLQKLMREEWFGPMLTGGALGAAVGLIRDRDKVLGLLQRVGRAILSVLAPLLGAGLVFFVLALLFTGLGPLWRETAATTPILLACILGATILANAVIGNAPEEEPRARVLHWAAMALGAVMLPLAIVAAISMGKRIGQYGFTPDRLWATVVVAVAIAGAAAYLLALVRGRRDFAAHVRRYNVALALGICLLAIFLALPLVNFGAISARDQVAMLKSGKIAPDRFDWRAMRFDFGPAGRKALEGLRAAGPTADIRTRAARALRETDRWQIPDPVEAGRAQRTMAAIRILPATVPLPDRLRARLARIRACADSGFCILLYEPGATTAVLVAPSYCVGENLESAQLVLDRGTCEPDVTVFSAVRGDWRQGSPEEVIVPGDALTEQVAKANHARARADFEALKRNQVVIRSVTRRQVFIDGRPVGEPFE